MFRSLMFKSNPLAQQFQLYRRKNQQLKPFSFKSTLTNHPKSYPHKNHHFSQTKKSHLKNIQYDQFSTIDQTLSSVTERNTSLNQDKKQKCKFKIHNAVKNDNFLQKDHILSIDQQKQTHQIKERTFKNTVLNPETQKLIKIDQESTHNRHRSRNVSKQTKANVGRTDVGITTNAKDSRLNKQMNLNSQIKNQLKSTLYQSIDLGNLFEKIQSNIDQSQKMTSSQLHSNKEPFSPDFTNTVTKKTQIRRIQVNKHDLKDPISHNKINMNKFNLKNLIDQNQTTKQGSIQPPKQGLTPQKILDKSFFQSLTSRTQQQHTQKQKNNMPHQNYGMDEKRQQNWMSTKRKRSIAIVMDDNGVIKEESSGIVGQNEADNLRMSIKISNLRQMMKGDQLEFS